MRRIQVLGFGCVRCEKLAENAKQAARELGIEGEVEKISDIEQIVSLGVLAMPALVIDGRLKTSGRIPSPDEIKTYLV
jgi:small redox-active disulfide protein 2